MCFGSGHTGWYTDNYKVLRFSRMRFGAIGWATSSADYAVSHDYGRATVALHPDS